MNYESHSPTEQFTNNVTTYCFQPHILQPTRITDHTATLIDNIYFNSLEHDCISGNLVSNISDRLPNFLIFNKFTFKSTHHDVYHRDYSDFNQEQFVEEVRLVNWEEVLYDTEDVNHIFYSFYTKISETVEKHVPLRKTSMFVY